MLINNFIVFCLFSTGSGSTLVLSRLKWRQTHSVDQTWLMILPLINDQTPRGILQIAALNSSLCSPLMSAVPLCCWKGNWGDGKLQGYLQNLDRLRSTRGSCDSQRVEDVLMHNDAGVGRWRQSTGIQFFSMAGIFVTDTGLVCSPCLSLFFC